MLVETHLNTSEYKLFKEKANQLGVSEYELAKQSILTTIEQPTSAIKVQLILNKLLEAVAKDIDQTKLI